MLAWMAWTWQTALFFCLVAHSVDHSDLLAIFGRRRRESGFFVFRRREAIGSLSP